MFCPVAKWEAGPDPRAKGDSRGKRRLNNSFLRLPDAPTRHLPWWTAPNDLLITNCRQGRTGGRQRTHLMSGGRFIASIGLGVSVLSASRGQLPNTIDLLR